VLLLVLVPPKTVVTPVTVATPEPAPLPEPVKDTAATTGTATLRLFVKPWGNVTIDGEARGITPTFRFAKLTIGEHEVVVSNPAFGERKVTVLFSHLRKLFCRKLS